MPIGQYKKTGDERRFRSEYMKDLAQDASNRNREELAYNRFMLTGEMPSQIVDRRSVEDKQIDTLFLKNQTSKLLRGIATANVARQIAAELATNVPLMCPVVVEI